MKRKELWKNTSLLQREYTILKNVEFRNKVLWKKTETKNKTALGIVGITVSIFLIFASLMIIPIGGEHVPEDGTTTLSLQDTQQLVFFGGIICGLGGIGLLRSKFNK